VSSVRFKILNALTKGSVAAIGIFLVACSPYGGKIIIKGVEEADIFKNTKDKAKERRKISVYINRLKSDGLIELDESVAEKAFKLTEKGRLWLVKNREYEVQKSNSVQIISFDIPEKERSKRHWLRQSLLNMKFQKIQQSVWIGKSLIPRDFLNDIKELKIYPYIEIFSISKSGTLKRIEDI
jgi:DNA-binding transcriptional regulator PaaX